MQHGQKVHQQPIDLIERTGNEVLNIPDGHLCCGSAGTYNIDQPEVADTLGREKTGNIVSTDADLVATGNIGCMTQLKTHLEQRKSAISVRHTMQVLRDAYCETDD